MPRSKTSSLDCEGEAFQAFVKTYEVKYQKAADCLTKGRDALLAFYDFPAEHWKYLRTTTPIESTFATVRHRTVRSKGCPSNTAALAMVSKLVEGGETLEMACLSGLKSDRFGSRSWSERSSNISAPYDGLAGRANGFEFSVPRARQVPERRVFQFLGRRT